MLRQQAVRVQHRLLGMPRATQTARSEGMGSIPLASCWLFTFALGFELQLRASLLSCGSREMSKGAGPGDFGQHASRDSCFDRQLAEHPDPYGWEQKSGSLPFNTRCEDAWRFARIGVRFTSNKNSLREKY